MDTHYVVMTGNGLGMPSNPFTRLVDAQSHARSVAKGNPGVRYNVFKLVGSAKTPELEAIWESAND